MSPYKCMFAKSRKSKGALRTNSFFDQFSRSKSDAMRVTIASMLGFPLKGISAYDDFLSLPKPDLTNVSELPNLQDFQLLQIRALFSKDGDIKSPIDKKQVAFEAFLESERSCEIVNRNFRENFFSKNGDLNAIIFYAQGKIGRILGELPTSNEAVACPTIKDLQLTFGPGASTSCRKITNARHKLSALPSITYSSLRNIASLSETLPYFSPKGGDCMDAVIEFVPKNLKTDRMICIEPTVSGMIQRGIGTVLKRKLRSAGINLEDQTINKMRARVGSLTGKYCTIDLERASDSVSTGLVLELVPIDWYLLMDMCRSKQVQYKNQTYRLEKFSSMGNGYTFELESMIFYALAYGIATHFKIPFDVSIYGDDIVTTTELAKKIFEYFPIFGFTPNTEKSFTQGQFRESCGGDFWCGVDSRPFYIKGRMSVSTLVMFHNFLFRKPWFDPSGDIRLFLLGNIPKYFQNIGPDGYGDGHLIAATYPKARYKVKDGWSGYTFETVIKVPFEEPDNEISGDALLPAYTASCYVYKSPFESIDPTKWDVSSLGSNPFSRRQLRNERSLGKKIRIYVLD